MSDTVLFAFIDPAMQFIAICAAVFILLFFLSTLSDVLRARVAVRNAKDYDYVTVRPST